MDTFWLFVKVFLVGGALCVIGEVLILKTKLTSARILVLYVVAGAILTAAGLYKPLVDFAAAGATVPKGREMEFLELVDRMVGEQKAQKKDAG